MRLPPDPYDRTVTFLPTTETENLEIHVRLGEPVLRLDGKRIEIGSIVRAQGTITAFRGERQIDLKRLFHVQNTNEEAEHWMRVAKWKETVLDQPWILTKEQRVALDQKARLDEEKKRQRASNERKQAQSRDAHRKSKQKRREQKREEEEAKMNAGALRGSHILPTPWED